MGKHLQNAYLPYVIYTLSEWCLPFCNGISFIINLGWYVFISISSSGYEECCCPARHLAFISEWNVMSMSSLRFTNAMCFSPVYQSNFELLLCLANSLQPFPRWYHPLIVKCNFQSLMESLSGIIVLTVFWKSVLSLHVQTYHQPFSEHRVSGFFTQLSVHVPVIRFWLYLSRLLRKNVNVHDGKSPANITIYHTYLYVSKKGSRLVYIVFSWYTSIGHFSTTLLIFSNLQIDESFGSISFRHAVLTKL